MASRILVVQHGEKLRQPGDPGLTTLGRAQATTTAKWLQEASHPSQIVSSPLRRAHQTATLIGDRLELAVSVDPRLRERMKWEDEQQQSLQEFLAEWDAASRDRAFVPTSGDSSRDAAARFLTAIEELARSTDGGADAIVVAHGGVTVDALRTLLDDEHLRRQQADLIEQGVPSCAITQLCWEPNGWQVRFPSTAHLEDEVQHDP